VIFSVACQLTRCLLDCLMLLTRRETSRDAELLVLRHENAVLRRLAGRVRYQPADRLWLAALSRLIPRHQWNKVFPVTPATLLAWHRLWVPKMPSLHATCEYSWRRPPSLSRRRTRMLSSADTMEILPSGGLWPRARCGRWLL
jgi:hypothetical protein